MKDGPKTLVVNVPNVGDVAGLEQSVFSGSSGAIANAYARATGIKPRKFPLNASLALCPPAPQRSA
jgi:isoquinoline 1-oxidoreductase beta subunit